MTNQEIYDLIARFESSTLGTLKLSNGDFSLELSKDGTAGAAPVAAPVSSGAATPAVKPEENDTVITAPLVGTLYAAPAPEAAPFVTVGKRVKKGQTVCLIEAMKMLSEIPAPCDCIITEILKENGSLVAFHEPIFRYKPC